MKPAIDPHDLSIVIQGPIVGKPTDPPEQQWTRRACESARLFFPGAEIILSTWAGSDSTGIDCDKVINNIDPGQVIYKWGCRSFSFSSSVNRMIYSVVQGLKSVTRQFSIRMRSDMYFTSNSCLSFWGRYTDSSMAKILKERIIVKPCYRNSYIRPFYVCDFFTLGLTEDVLQFWDVPLLDKSVAATRRMPPFPFRNPIIDQGPNSEQYIYFSFLKKSPLYRQILNCDTFHEAARLIKTSPLLPLRTRKLPLPNARSLRQLVHEQSVADNLVVASSDQIGVDSFKYPGHLDARKDSMAGQEFIIFEDWKQLYKRYVSNTSKFTILMFVQSYFTLVKNEFSYQLIKSKYIAEKAQRRARLSLRKIKLPLKRKFPTYYATAKKIKNLLFPPVRC